MRKGTRNQLSTAVTEPTQRAEGAESRRHDGGDLDRPITTDRIAQRAYELFLNRGGQDGGDLDDWLQAERELERSGSPHGQS